MPTLQVWVGLAVCYPISFKPQTHMLPVSKSQPGGLDFQKSKKIVVNRDHHSFWIQGKHSGGGRRLFYQMLCNAVCLALPFHLEHIIIHE